MFGNESYGVLLAHLQAANVIDAQQERPVWYKEKSLQAICYCCAICARGNECCVAHVMELRGVSHACHVLSYTLWPSIRFLLATLNLYSLKVHMACMRSIFAYMSLCIVATTKLE
jgi:hypothetical protein